jgi:hypothetical protein
MRTGFQNKANDSDHEEATLYLVFSPLCANRHRVYTDEDIYALGGIHAIERVLESETYWFSRLGTIWGTLGPHGVTFDDAEIAKLPVPPVTSWKVGRCNPAFAGSELERLTFRAMFSAIERMLSTWNVNEDGVVDAYALKELQISHSCLRSLVISLQTLGHVHVIAKITVTKYWYDQSWSGSTLPSDLVLAEYSLLIPLHFAWSTDERLISAQVMTVCLC